MAKGSISVKEDICKGCSLCIPACPLDLLELNKEKVNVKGYQAMRIHSPEKCTGCTNCAIMCPESCITVTRN